MHESWPVDSLRKRDRTTRGAMRTRHDPSLHGARVAPVTVSEGAKQTLIAIANVAATNRRTGAGEPRLLTTAEVQPSVAQSVCGNLALARCLGIHSVMSYGVERRTHEFGGLS